MADSHKDLSAQDARQGVETGTVRWVLRISRVPGGPDHLFQLLRSLAGPPRRVPKRPALD